MVFKHIYYIEKISWLVKGWGILCAEVDSKEDLNEIIQYRNEPPPDCINLYSVDKEDLKHIKCDACKLLYFQYLSSKKEGKDLNKAPTLIFGSLILVVTMLIVTASFV